MKEKFFQYNTSKIFYRIAGNGKPVILIHGFGEDGDIWNKQVEFLKDNFQLIIPDLPGSGRSELVMDADIETYSEIIKEIITREVQKPPLILSEVEGKGEEGVVMLGHSLGGYITLAFAEKYPHMLSSFGLIHSTAFADSEEKKAARLRSIEFINKNGAYEFLRTAIPGLFYPSGRSQRPDGLQRPGGLQPLEESIEQLIEKGRSFTSEAMVQYYQAMIHRPDRTQVLKTFPRPILFIIGQHDNAVPFAQSLQQCYLPTQSHIHILRNSAHMGMWEEKEKVNQTVFDFSNVSPKGD